MIAWMQFGGIASLVRLLVASLALVPLVGLSAAPVAYSGKITIQGFAHDGPGHFRFQLIDPQGAVLWQNAPNNGAVTTQVTRGHYSVLLGDAATPNMAAIPPNLFLDHPVVFLRVHFSEGQGKPFQHLQPDQRILSSAHALTADVANAVKPGSITTSQLNEQILNLTAFQN